MQDRDQRTATPCLAGPELCAAASYQPPEQTCSNPQSSERPTGIWVTGTLAGLVVLLLCEARQH